MPEPLVGGGGTDQASGSGFNSIPEGSSKRRSEQPGCGGQGKSDFMW